jgi:low temperature requirement protein LtrA
LLAYFDFFQIRGQQILADRSGVERTGLARDVYTYLHLPMVAGIVLFAFALKATLAHVGDDLDTIPALGLCGGPALYLFAYVALRFRVARTLGGGRLVAAVACALV